ncbi:MAG: hypothetical protein HKN32_09720 [Flavobacteriales bacterium]|nr:hypothetical protein [Flavobacteriales bacterium]
MKEFEGDQLDFVDMNLEPGTFYYYRIFSQKDDESSMPSLVQRVKTQYLPIAAPENLSAEIVNTTSARISWEDLSDNETEFKLQRAVSIAFNDFVSVEISSNTVEFFDRNLEPGATYFYRLKAVNADTTSSFTSIERVELNILDVETDHVLVYPSPAHDLLNVDSFQSIREIGLLDLFGKKVESWKISDRENFTLPITCPSGLYLLEITFSNLETATTKVVIE